MGLMSGTSVDGIDAVVVRFGEHKVSLLAGLSHPYPASLRERLLGAILDPGKTTVDTIGTFETLVGEVFRDAALAVIEASGQRRSDIKAIGSHGQTLRHQPDSTPRFTIQVGDPSIIATGTGITTVADFRRQDMALGGQGAPLVPPFHEWLFADIAAGTTVIANIGGITNITILPADGSPVRGFDTGPGNTLMDAWIRHTRNVPYDAEGAWAASGNLNHELLAGLMRDDYFRRPPPKSTGFEHFNLDWLHNHDVAGLDPADVQATLLELTARSLANAVDAAAPDCSSLFVCGGGVHNTALVGRIRALLQPADVESTASRGLDPDWVEASAFAWLARERMSGRVGNLPGVTGASRPSSLGAVYRL